GAVVYAEPVVYERKDGEGRSVHGDGGHKEVQNCDEHGGDAEAWKPESGIALQPLERVARWPDKSQRDRSHRPVSHFIECKPGQSPARDHAEADTDARRNVNR